MDDYISNTSLGNTFLISCSTVRSNYIRLGPGDACIFVKEDQIEFIINNTVQFRLTNQGLENDKGEILDPDENLVKAFRGWLISVIFAR